jgi:hypothetical protein
MINIINELDGHGYARCDYCCLLFEFDVHTELNLSDKSYPPLILQCPRCCKFDIRSDIILLKEVERFLNIVNPVTASHRHGRKIPKKYLDELSNRQLDMEKLIKEYKNGK